MKKEMTASDRSPPRVAVFTGDDSIGREKAKAEMMGAIHAIHDDVAEERFDPSTERFEEFTTRMITPSLFQSMRIFCVRHANQLSATEREELARIMRYDIPDAYLIVEFDESVNKKGALTKVLAGLDVKALAKKQPERVAVLEFAKPPDYKIPEWLTRQVPLLFGRTIRKDDAEYLVDCLGSDLDTLYSELQKIDIHLPSRAPVDRAAIESVSGATRTPSAFELARALGGRNLPLALDIVDSLFASSFYAPPCTAASFRHFWGLFRIRAFAKSHPDVMKRYLGGGGGYNAQTDIAHQIGVAAGLLSPDDPVKKAYPVIILSRAVEQARSFVDEDLVRILRLLRTFDVDTKTGRMEADRKTFKLLCYRIVRMGEYEPTAVG